MRPLTMWLVTYNALASVGWLGVLWALWEHRGPHVANATAAQWASTLPALRILNVAAFVEVVHVVLGVSRGGFLPTLAQAAFRAFQSFIVLPIVAGLSEELLPRQQSLALSVVAAWASIEVIRYPFYVSQLLRRDLAALTWLRYTAWIVLYPIGILGEMAMLYCALPTVHTRYGAAAFYASAFLLALAPWLALGMLQYMWRQRRAKLGPSAPAPKQKRN